MIAKPTKREASSYVTMVLDRVQWNYSDKSRSGLTIVIGTMARRSLPRSQLIMESLHYWTDRME